MPPNHVGRWNERCFEEIGRQNGFHIEDYKVEKFSFTPMAKQFIIYRLLRRSQQAGSLENKVFKIKKRYPRKILKMIGVVVNSITAIPALTQMNSGLGGAQMDTPNQSQGLKSANKVLLASR